MVLSVLQDICSLLEWSSCVLVIPLRWSIGCNTVYTSSYRTEIAGWHPLQHQNRCMLGHPALPGSYIHSPELSPSIHIVNLTTGIFAKFWFPSIISLSRLPKPQMRFRASWSFPTFCSEEFLRVTPSVYSQIRNHQETLPDCTVQCTMSNAASLGCCKRCW